MRGAHREPYELTLESTVHDASYTFRTADGVVSKRAFREAELLLLEALWDADVGRLLCPEANYGVVGTVLADRAESVGMTESSARRAALCRRNAAENGRPAAVSLVADPSTLEGDFDTAAYAPKPYAPIAVGKRRIADALSALSPGGRLYLAASKRTGLARYRDCLDELSPCVERIAKRDGYRLLEATRPAAFDPPTYVTPKTLRPRVAGVDLSLVTVPGLFAASRLDDGTRLLLESASVEDGDRVLDLACGYGAIGAYAASVADCEVWLSDDDRVATRCAERTLRTSGVDGTVVTADCVEGVADLAFDRVLCNPPTHAGNGVLSELFAGVADVLATDGALEIVHHRDLDLREYLAPFDRIETRRTGAEHVVLRAVP